MDVSYNSSRLRCVALAVALALGIPAAYAQPDMASRPYTEANLDWIEARVTADLQRIVDGQKRIEGQGKDVVVKARFETIQGRFELVIDLSRAYLPFAHDPVFQELENQLTSSVHDWLRGSVEIDGVTVLFDGKPDTYYFHELFLQDQRTQKARDAWEAERAKETRNDAASPATALGVVVSAGHGLYFHHKYQDWRAQREVSHGITEDFVTPAYAAELTRWLEKRSTAKTFQARSISTEKHESSGHPWSDVAARYHLEKLYPENPEIWHSKPETPDDPLREYKEDILSRPLFANHIGAQAFISLHTNASDDSNKSGVRVFQQKYTSHSQELVRTILCSMEETIHAQDAYKTYLVPVGSGDDGDYGELRKAKMPAVIVEVGFHTNEGDAAALKDPIFRTAAMKGVERGYRLFTQGEKCQKFEIWEIPKGEATQGAPAVVEIKFKGHPQYPVTVKMTVDRCPPGWECKGIEATYPEGVPSPFKLGYQCPGTYPLSNTVWFHTTLTDADGVVTSQYDHGVNCNAPKKPDALRALVDAPSTGNASG